MSKDEQQQGDKSTCSAFAIAACRGEPRQTVDTPFASAAAADRGGGGGHGDEMQSVEDDEWHAR